MDLSSHRQSPNGSRGFRLQAPLVDSVSCYCRVDSGLKTVVEARKFVPGSKLCIQPDINPNAHRRSKNSKRERTRIQPPLLPGLPDDLAVACLIRVPRAEHRKLRLVCKRWYRLASGNFFYSQRKLLGMSEEWVYVFKRDRDGKISWNTFDPVSQHPQPLPPVPREYSEAVGFGCAVLSGCHLYLFGGKDPLRGSMRRVIFYNARTNKWHRAPDMLRKRHFFGSCVINNCLYVAGGECEGIQRTLRSAEVYDPNKNRWSFVADMSTAMVPLIGVVYDKKWFLKGLGSHQQVMSEAYDPETNSWRPVSDGMVTGWRNPCTSLNGRLYGLDCRDGCKLRVFDETTDSWNKFMDSRVHLGNSRALEAAALVPLNNKLCIIRNVADVVQLSIFNHRFMGIAEQMGRTLQRTSISTNIKERLDFSCALFSPDGGLVANAPHVPVHLGAMSSTVRWQLKHWGENLNEGDVLVTNHPCAGGSHLPDITVITPVFDKGKLVFFVASRGHHAEVGGITPGSMPPFSKAIWEEGAAIKAFKVVEKGVFQEEGIIKLLQFPSSDETKAKIPGTRRIQDNLSDLQAQIAANQRGIALIKELIEQYGLGTVQDYMKYVQLNAEEAVREMLKSVAVRVSSETPTSRVGNTVTIEEEDYMDDGSVIHLKLTIDADRGEAFFDFTGTSPEVYGNWNAPEAVTSAAVIYCLRCLVNVDIPLNQGCLAPVEIRIPAGSFLSPSEKAAVVGGNVLTSQRVTDVVLTAFKACACSQGCMNNLTFGDDTFGYYETIGGGCGAGPTWDGTSGIQCHMTNTRMTDPEIFEQRYPVLLHRFGLREKSGGSGLHKGGDGLVREIEFRKPVVVSILSERRVHSPRGLNGGQNGARGANYLITKDKRRIYLGGKNTVHVDAGEILQILTPGGGGFGSDV